MSVPKTYTTQFPLGRRFGLLMRLYFGALTKRLEALDLDRHYSVLILLETSQEKCSQQDISEFLRIDKATVVRMLDFLVRKKYIKRVVNPNDRREHHICLTDKARKDLPLIHKAIDELNETALNGLTDTQIKNFYAGLEALTSNLVEEPAHNIIVNVKKAKSLRK